MIAIIDYGVGNLFSLSCSIKAAVGGDVGRDASGGGSVMGDAGGDAASGGDVVVTGDADEIRKADKLILPGVGAFGDAADKLFASGLADVVKEEAAKGKPLLGICLGMQLLFDESHEYGVHRGLGLIHGRIVSMEGRVPAGLSIPHIGWNALHFTKESPIFKYVKEGDCVYFVHSFYGVNCDDSVTATAEYGIPITASVEKGNIFGCQFHPEKSGEVGLSILRAFCRLGGK